MNFFDGGLYTPIFDDDFNKMIKNLKKKSDVRRMEICPFCGRKNVNIYKNKDNVWMCKNCIDERE